MKNSNLKTQSSKSQPKTRKLSAPRRGFSFCVFPFELKRGFTLLEMIISVGIFSVLIVASIGVTLGISNAQAKAANIQAILDNIRFSLELVTKEMRTGSGYQLSAICAQRGSEISFTTSSGERRIYFLNPTTEVIMRAKEPLISADCTNIAKVKPFTAEEVAVERLNFSELNGDIPGPLDGQPRITMTLKVRSRSPKYHLQSSMDLQTTVVQRLRDL